MNETKKKYCLYVYCKRGGLSVDEGKESEMETYSVEGATTHFLKDARALKRLGHYDSVACQVTEGEDGPIVHRFSV
jgi:hypothetical protein